MSDGRTMPAFADIMPSPETLRQPIDTTVQIAKPNLSSSPQIERNLSRPIETNQIETKVHAKATGQTEETAKATAQTEGAESQPKGAQSSAQMPPNTPPETATMSGMFKDKVKHIPATGQDEPKAQPKALPNAQRKAKPKDKLCKKPAAEILRKRPAAPDTDLQFQGIGRKRPLHYKASTVFFDTIRKQWRVKPAPGRRDETKIAWGDSKQAQHENWKKVVERLVALNK